MYRKISVIFFVFFLCLGFTSIPCKAQISCQPTVPDTIINLSSNPDSVFDAKVGTRLDYCCGASGTDRCIKFIVTLHPSVGGVYFGARNPGPSGAMYFVFECDTINKKYIVNQDTACVDGPGPHNITICKPGGDNPIYTVAGVGKGKIIPPSALRNSCSDTMIAQGFKEDTLLKWESVPYNATYSTYLSCTTACDTIMVTPKGAYPDSVRYRVCGQLLGLTCTGGAATKCDTTTVYFKPSLSANITPDPVSICFGGPPVTLTGTGTGGVLPYTYLWSTAATTSTISVSTGGLKWVEIKDSLPCPGVRDSIVVSAFLAPIDANAGLDDTSCAYSPNTPLVGTVTGVSTGKWLYGAGTFTPNRDSLSVTYAPTAGEISAGLITLALATTNNGTCAADTDTVVIRFSQNMVLSTAITNVSCFGGSNGAIDLTITSGGMAAFTYNWTNSATTQDISSLSIGTFAVTVRDAAGCTATTAATITQPASALTTTISGTNVTCNAACNGSASLTPAGGTGAYTYSWTNGATTASISSLCAATYTGTVKDANGCTTNASVVITEPAAALTNSIISTNVSCFGGSNGTVDLTVSGGTVAYTYRWTTGATTEDISGLIAGTYTITTTDANGCQDIDAVIITQPAAALTNSIISTNVSCFGGSNGTVDLTVSGGTVAYTYRWTTGATTEDVSGLIAGTYTITTTDANGCQDIDAVIITQPAAALTNSIISTNVSCFGGSNGTVDLTVSGGTVAYTYRWTTGATTEDVSGLIAGTYTITTTDANGCQDIDAVIITQPAAALTNSIVSTNVSCFGGSNGSVDLTVSGGTVVYTYRWTTGATTEDVSGLIAGTYTITTTDANSCQDIDAVIITQPAAALTNSIISTNVSCFGGSNGTVDLTVSGGTVAYTYRWTTGATTEDVSGLIAGTYTITTTDANGCQDIDAVIITQPAAALTNSIISTNVSCFGGSNGTVDLTVSGGTVAYTYRWTTGATTEDVSGLIAGTYTITTTDANGCQDIDAVIITQPAAALTNSIVSTNVSCFGGSNGSVDLTVSGGTVAYTYSWTNGATTEDISGLIAGTYTITTTDANGCQDIDAVIITQPAAALTNSIISTNVSCFGGSNGTVDLTVSGGTVAYTYRWTTGATTEDVSGLIAGTYTITTTDANGCQDIDAVIITQPAAALTNSIVSTNVSCFGGSNGTVDLTVSGGTVAYTYGWTTGATTEDVSGLIAGTYTITTTDANGCQDIDAVIITQPAAALTNSIISTNVSCFGGSNGTVDLTVSGGTVAYTYRWTTGATTEDVSGLITGTYTITTTDANGCQDIDAVIITQPAAALTNSIISTNVSCFGGSNGTVDLTVSGGTVAYTYRWTTGATTEDISGLIAGTYTITTTDANGCQDIDAVIITQPAAALTNSIVSTNVSCFGGSNGTVDLTVSGGTVAYTYRWTTGATTEDVSGLIAGTYTITTTDANGCQDIDAVIITQPAAALTNSIISTNVSCFGGSNGTVDLTVSGGTVAYTYRWTTGATTEDISGLIAGTYTITTTDANGCQDIDAVIITQPAAALTNSIISTNVSCFGGSNGTVDLTVSGGTVAYTYRWTIGATTEDVSGLIAGTYTITTTDANGCQDIDAVIITQPAAALTNSIVSTNVSCFGGSNGTVDLTVSGGTVAYTYRWTTGATTEDVSGLIAGTYTITTTDANGCQDIDAIIITEPTVLTASTAGTNLLCNGVCIGAASISGAGGTVTYTYTWSNGGGGSTISSLCAGTYTGTVTDANGCKVTSSVTITQPASIPIITIASNDATCGASNGTITVSASGGTPAYSYLWSNGISDSTATALAAGTYVITVTDANGCKVWSNKIVNNLLAPTVYITDSIDISCFGGNDGSAKASFSGGTAPFSHLWTPSGQTTLTAVGLTAGSYIYQITDSSGCIKSKEVTLSQPPLLSIAKDSSNVSCFGGSNGVINITVSGGTLAYTYKWSNASTTEDLTGIVANTYTVTVTDSKGCKANKSIIITQPAAALTNSIISTNVSCFGGSNGTVDLTVSGGTIAYTYRWTTGATTEDVSGLIAGTYTITTTDANGCQDIDAVIITQPAAALTNSIISTNVSCFGGSNGTVDLTVSGGTVAYTYRWTTGATTEDVSGLIAGTYTITTTDANGCQDIDAVIITQPAAALTNSIISTNVSCFGGSNGTVDLTVSGGTVAYTYRWTTGATTEDVSGLIAGTYTITTTDANGCQDIDAVIITQPAAALTNSIVSTNVSCFGGSNGTVDLTVSGGTVAYTYRWTTGATTEDVSGLITGTYTITTTDANGCQDIDAVIITQPAAALSNSIVSTNVSCFGGSNGTVDLTVSGGTVAYTYKWSNGAITEDVSGLIAGTYTITTTDANGCQDIDAVIITQPAAALSNSIVSTNVSCFGGSNGTVDLTVSGGTVAYTYRWTTGATTEDVSGLIAGTYTITTTDANGCQDIDAVIITQPAAALTNSIISTNVSCFGGSNGTVDLTVSGGTVAYTYRWTTGATTEDVSGLIAGTYTITTTDANGCQDIDAVIITQPAAALTNSIVSTNVSCFGGSNGTVDLTVSGGTVAYTYKWSNGSTTEDISGLIAGTYTITTTDANGCQDIDAVIITQPAAALTNSIVSTNVSCFGGSNGTVDLTVSGGTVAYTYRWTTGATTEDVSGLIAGTYTITTTDANGCQDIDAVIITQPAAALSNSIISANVSCLGGSNGTVDLTVSGGTVAYTYKWSNGATTEDISGLIAGTYTITTTDANGCQDIDAVIITQPAAALTNSIVSTNVSCFGGSNGTVDLTVSGGTVAYTYRWTTGATTEDVSGLIAGTYTITTTDANGCQDIDAVIITQPAQTIVNTGIDVTVCANNAIVSLSGSVSGGVTTKGTWSSTGSGIFSPSVDSLNVSYTPSTSDTAIKNIILILTSTNNGICTAVIDSLLLTITPAPIVLAGKDDSTCRTNPNYVLNGYILHVAGGKWTTSGTGTFTPNDTTLNATYIPSNADTTAGNVTIILTSTGIGSCLAVKDTMKLTFTPDMIAVNAGTDITACANQTSIQLNGTVGVATGGIWSTSGSGTFSPNNITLNAFYNPSSADTLAGSITLKLTTTGNGGCVGKSDSMIITILDAIYVNAGPDQVVCANSDSITLSGTVVFATGGKWLTTGTGTFSPSDLLLNTYYIYSAADTAAGSVKLILESTGNNGCAPLRDTLLVSFIDAPAANFTFTEVCYGNPISFNGTTTDTANTTSWSWNFGDASTSILQSPTHNYVSSGIYNVSLVITSTLGCKDTVIKPVTVHPIPVVNFGTASGCYIDSVRFIDSTTIAFGTLSSWQWNFGDTKTSTLQNPAHLYSTDGTYTVTLIVESNFGCKDTLIKIVNVLPGAKPNFVYSASCINDSISFTDSSTISGGFVITSWLWNFGDGKTSTLQNPKNLYTIDTTFIVTLIVTSSSGCVDSIKKTIIVYPKPVPGFGFTSVCADDSVNFFDSTTVYIGTINGWKWNFGDGKTDSIKNPVHLYNSAGGIFNVQLIAYTNIGCADTITKPVLVHPVPAANFGTASGCYVDSVRFIDSTIITVDNIVNWQWNFGDGNTSTLQNPAHLYSLDGSYTVTLIVESNFGCKDTITKSINVLPGAKPNFGYLSTCVNDSISFSDSSIISGGFIITSWLWKFGDGNISSLQNPKHLYTSDTTILVTLVISSSSGCVDSIKKPVIVYPKPEPDFAYTNVCADDTISFFDSSTVYIGNVAGWKWDFGDGKSDSVQNPKHLYNSSGGIFNVQLIAFTNIGCEDTIIKPVLVHPKPNADFITNAECFVNSVFFNDATIITIDSIVNWSWNFGDGKTDSIKNPEHLYSGPGFYTVSLFVTSNFGCTDSVIKTFDVKPSPVAQFGNTSVCMNNLTAFSDSSTITSGSIVSWQWDFSDGGKDSSQNTTHVFSSDGFYNVQLIVTSDFNCIDTLVKQIVVYSIPVPDFIFSSGCLADGTLFTDSSNATIGTINGWYWNFGDGSSDTVQNPLHFYTVSDTTYNVELIVKTEFGCSDSITLPISTFPSPVADFSATEACLNNANAFTDNSNITSGSITGWYWIFGDGKVDSTSKNPVHLYNTDTVYTVKLIVTSNNGCTDTITKTIVVHSLPVGDFVNTAECLNEVILFKDSSTVKNSSIVSWLWSYDDGAFDTSQNPGHLFTASGTHSVSLIVTSSFGCKDTVSHNVLIYEPPVAGMQDIGDCVNQGSVFNDASVSADGIIVSWLWDFGDGTKDTSQNAIHVYLSDGSYTIIHIVISSVGCSDTLTRVLNVKPAPIADFSPSKFLVVPYENITFSNNSTVDAVSWLWDFGDTLGTSTEQNPIYFYETLDSHTVTLIAFNMYGCSDTIIKYVFTKLEPEPPAAFTPGNLDNINNILFVRGGPFKKLEMKIFNEWGELIFSSDNPETGWDGTKSGTPQPVGVYVYTMYAITEDNVVYRKHGNVTLLR